MEERSPKLSVKVRNLYNGEHGKLRAVLSVTIGGAYAIHGLKLYETEKGGCSCPCPASRMRRMEKRSTRRYSTPSRRADGNIWRKRCIWPTTWPWRDRSRRSG